MPEDCTNVNPGLQDRSFLNRMNTIVSKRPAPFLIGGFVAMMAVLAFAASAMAQGPGPGKIAYVADEDIWLMEADGTGKVSLGVDVGNFVAYDVALSPDATWLVFTGVSFGSSFPPGSNGLWLMKAEAYGPTNEPEYLGTNGATFSRASWHPDGRHVAYIGLDGLSTNQVYLVEALDENGEVAGAAPEALTSGAAGNSFADCAFSPDGQYLMASQLGQSLVMFQVFDAAGVRAGSLVVNPLPPITLFSEGYATWPSFSPDGKKVVFSHYKNGFAIAVLTIRDGTGNALIENLTTNPRVLHTPVSPGYLASPSWSPDGTKIVFHDSTGYYRLFTLNANEPENGSTNQRVEVAGVNGVDTKFPSFAHPGAPAPVPAPVPPDLISWWPGENAAWDVAGIGQGSMKNAPSPDDPYDVGKVGRAFWFDGVDDHIEGRSNGISLAQDMTIEVWVNPLSDTGEATILSKRDAAGDAVSYAFFLRDGKPVFRSVMSSVATEIAVTGDPLPIDEWTHLAFTEDDEVGRKIYVNGVLAASATGVPLRPTTNGPLTIGAFVDDSHASGTPGAPFDGLVDELSLYRRTLSDTEIGLIYQAGKRGKARQDPARDFSSTSNPNLPWRYGWVDGAGAPVPSRVTLGDPDLGGLFPTPASLDGTTHVYGADPGAHMLFNGSKTDRAMWGDGMSPTRITLAPRQFAFHPSVGGDFDYTVLQWIAPEEGKYALSATFTGVEDSPTNTDVHLFRGDTELFAGTVDSFLGDGTSNTQEVDLSESDTVTWIVGDGAGSTFDYTGVVASAVKLDEFQPFKRPELTRIDFTAPIMNGKTVTFIALNGDKPTNSGMTAKLQYSATPGVPGSWIDLPGGTMNSETSQGFKAILTNLPIGTFAFRVATTIDGLGTTFSAPSDTFEVLASASYLEVDLDVSSASDPTGDTTHRGDTLTYRAKFRNSGGAAAPASDQVQVLVRIPDGTTVAAGSTAGSTTVHSGPDSFAVWTVTKPIIPFDPEPAFTVSNVNENVIFSAVHNLEEGDLIELDSDTSLPGGLDESTIYEVFSVTSNQFKLRLPGTAGIIDIANGGTGTHRFKRLWQTRTLKLAVVDPPISSESTVDDVDPGDFFSTFSRITDRFHGLGGIEDSDTFETEVVSPLRLTAADPVVNITQNPNSPGFEVAQGSTMTVDFTLRNEASYRMNETFVRVLAPNGLTILGGVFTSGSGNPSVSETPNGDQLLLFECGPLDPGAERVCQAEFRVQYDFPFTAPDNSILYELATASTTRPPAVVYETQRYKQYYTKKNPKTGKKVRKFHWRTRKVPRNDARNGLERELENPFDLTVAESPGITIPVLEIYDFSQSGLGSAANAPDLFPDIPEDQRPGLEKIEMVADSTAPNPFATPQRLSSELLLRVDYQNTGDRLSEFNRIKIKIPDNVTYVTGSASVRAPDGIVNPTPTIQNGFHVFTVPFLDPGETNNLTFKVKLRSGTPVSTLIFHDRPTILSRDLRKTYQTLKPGLLAYTVTPAVMKYEKSSIPTYITNGNNEITGVSKWEFRIDYFNQGAIAANGVGIRYYIPPGLRFSEAYFSDFVGTKLTSLQSRVAAPAANAPSGTVIFNVGQIPSKGVGRVVVLMVPDSANVPQRNIYGDQTDSLWETYDSSTTAPTGPRTLLGAKESLLFDASTPYVPPLHADPYLVIEGRIAAHVGDQVTYQFAAGNSGTNDVNTGFVALPIPLGSQFVSYEYVGSDLGNADAHLLLAPNSPVSLPGRNFTADELGNTNGCLFVPVSIGVNGSVVFKVTLEMIGEEEKTVVLEPKIILGTRTISGAAFQTFRPKASDPLDQQISGIYSIFMGSAAGPSLGTADHPNTAFLDHHGSLSLDSRSVSVMGADTFQTNTGLVLVQAGARIVAAGGGNVVANDGAGLESIGAAVVSNDGAGFIMAGDSDKITLGIPEYGRGTAQFAINHAANIVAAGGGNIVAAGGGNLVRPAFFQSGTNVSLAAQLIGQDGASLATYVEFGDGSRKFILPDLSELTFDARAVDSLMAASALIGKGGASIIGEHGAGIIGEHGAGIVAGGGGNIFFANRNNFIPSSAIVAAGGGNIVAAGGGNIVAAGGGNIVAAGGGNLEAIAKGNFFLTKAGIVAAGGGN